MNSPQEKYEKQILLPGYLVWYECQELKGENHSPGKQIELDELGTASGQGKYKLG